MTTRSGSAANERAKAALARTQTADAAAENIQHPPKKLIDVLNDPSQKEQIQNALPGNISVERFTRICLSAVRASPQLQQCSTVSILAACMQSAQLGLEPGILGQAYLVPFYNRSKQAYEVQFIIGYQGYIDLFYRSGHVTSVVAREVCENDEFDFSYGISDVLSHRPAKRERGDPEQYYGIVRMRNGDHLVHVMNLEEIAERRARSKADNGPWVTDERAMSRKTVIRAMVPFVPKTVELGQALAADETVPVALQANMADSIDRSSYIDVDSEETGADPDQDPGPGSDPEPGPDADPDQD